MLVDKAIKFHQLHTGGNCFVLANAWNAGTAILLEQVGFDALSQADKYPMPNSVGCFPLLMMRNSECIK